MTAPTVTETVRNLQPVDHDPFIDDVASADTPPPPPAPSRRRILD